ncbi:MAG: enoyl-CoA hydratase/isomerase family protein [Deltaproteobacteria bacterium]|nr:enoyl-CoA hydratase/isomerase family protein [Deltaproteobacteria bacterium]
MTADKLEKDVPVIYKRQGKVGHIILNRPEKRNALNSTVWQAIGKAVAAAKRDEEARVVILQGAGKSFCAGLDLSAENELMKIFGGKPTAKQKVEAYNMIIETQEIHTRLERIPKPTIAAIHGHCLGAGLELVVCCDIRLCSAETVFALPEATLAIITDVGGLQRLPKIVGPGHAREIAFRGHRFDAEKAKSINLVNDVYKDRETLYQKALEMAEEIAGNPPLAVQGAKEVMLFDEEANLDESLQYNAARSSMLFPSEDLFEAMNAYLERRKGEFKGA